MEATVVGEGAAAEQAGHDFDRLAESRQALARAGHLHPDRFVVGFVPTRTEADVEATTRDAIERRQ